MKKISFVLVVCSSVLFSCAGGDDKAPAVPAAVPATAEVAVATEPMPYPATVADDWTIGNPERIRTVLNIYKNMVNDTLYDDIKNHLADTLTNLSYDNKETKLTPEQFVQAVIRFRKGHKSLTEEFKSYVCLHSNKLDIDQVTLWVKETAVDLSGKLDSSVYQEEWRFNNAGKLFHRGTYMRD